VDKEQKKRTADVAEKLGVGLLLGTMAQGIFAKDLSSAMYGIGAVVLAIAIFFHRIGDISVHGGVVMGLILMAAVAALIAVLVSLWLFSRKPKTKHR